MSAEIIRRAKGKGSEGAVALERDTVRLEALARSWGEQQKAQKKVISPAFESLVTQVEVAELQGLGTPVLELPITLPGIPPLDDAKNVLVLPFDYLEKKPGPGGTAAVDVGSGNVDVKVGNTSGASDIGGTLSAQAAIGVAFEAVRSGLVEIRPMITTSWWWSLWSYSGLDCRVDGYLGASIIEPGMGMVASAPNLPLFSRRADSGWLGTDNPSSDGGGPIGGALNMRFNAHSGHVYQFWMTAFCSGQQSGKSHAFAFSTARAGIGARLLLVVAEYV